MSNLAHKPVIELTADPWVRYHACKAMARGYAEARKTDKNRLSHARSFCVHLIDAYWVALCNQHQTNLHIKSVPASISLSKIAVDAQHLAENTGRLIADFPVEDAGYLIGSIYTVMLPAAMRSDLGAYYTPPPLVERMLDLAEAAGFDFIHGTAIDPACGGGAFLAPVALRMLKKSPNTSPGWMLRRLAARLKGIEIDPFAAWITLTLLEAALMPLLIEAKRRLPVSMILVGDALELKETVKYDLVIGNPPYGRVTLNEPMRSYYARSLYGHANLYGLFTDLALHLVKPKGVIAYLTPTSFLGGKYFKTLRKLLSEHVTPVAFDFVADREGVFDDVLQETMLTAYRNEPVEQEASVSLVVPKGLNTALVESIGSFKMMPTGDPWMLPRAPADAHFLKSITQMPTRLSDLGYTVSTGPLVWNRHKSQLRTHKTTNTLPLVWAESISASGFIFGADRRNHVPYIEIRADQPHLLTVKSCVLVQRTTSKEQNRRVLAAVVPQDFLDEHGGAVIENHLNMVIPPALNLLNINVDTIEALLNTVAIDRAFRCISGSVAVSAYELNALPLPTLAQMDELQILIAQNVDKEVIERKVASYYGVTL